MPIIKSKGRKDRDYKQLVEYMFHHDKEQEHSFTYLHNMYDTTANDHNKIIAKLTKNISHLRKRKGGVGMYHEMISFSPEDTVYLQDHPEIIEDIAERYMELRVGQRVGIAKPHYDKEHIHIHCCFTPNEMGARRTSRMSKADFLKVRRSIEEYQLTNYPDLHHSYVHLRDAEKSKDESLSPSEWGMKQRGKSSNTKNSLSAMITPIIMKSDSLNSIDEGLRAANLQPYYRYDLLQGVMVGNRKYRLTTLVKDTPDLMVKLKDLIQSERRNNRQLGQSSIDR